jgi:hypothetical protein
MAKKDKLSAPVFTIHMNEDGVEGYCGEDLLILGDLESWKDIKIELEEKVNHPSHYTQGSVECIEALESATSNLTGIDAVCTANAIKYMWRWKQKGGLEDLKKAKWYIERLITKWENHEVIY